MKPTAYSLQPAFTLIELLVVIVVIAILMGITLPVSKYAIRRAKEARQEVMRAKMRSALDDYRATYGEYPITPTTNAFGQVRNYSDAIRHYPDNYPTYCASTTNSPCTNVYLTSSGTVENIQGCLIDYALTYPLMFKQLDKGSRPFMKFDDVTVMYLVYRSSDADKHEWTERRKTRSGWRSVLQRGIYGNAVNRAKAIDPVTGYQWHYVCSNGINYELSTTNQLR